MITFRGDGNLFLHWQSYLVLSGMGTCIYLQIKWLNEALMLFDSLYVVPVFQSFWILFSVLSGMMYFGEYNEIFATGATAPLFPLGLGITIFGVYILSQRDAESEIGEREGEEMKTREEIQNEECSSNKSTSLPDVIESDDEEERARSPYAEPPRHRMREMRKSLLANELSPSVTSPDEVVCIRVRAWG